MVSCGQGDLAVEITLAFGADDVLHGEVSWRNPGQVPLTEVAVGVALELPEMVGEKVTIPQVLYNNNPSAATDRIVPKLGVGPTGGLVCEEHRLPIPGVNVEWNAGGTPRHLSFLSFPSYVRRADGMVQYGALGAVRKERLTLVATSGPVMFNGHADVAYVHKSRTAPTDDGYLEVLPGASVTKSYAWSWGRHTRPGHGFRELVRTGRRLFNEEGAAPLSLDEIIGYKRAALDDRWTVAGAAAGYVKFNAGNAFGASDKRSPHLMYGWTGQCLKLAWCDAAIGLATKDRSRVERCRRAVDFYLWGSVTPVRGLRMSTYWLEEGRWSAFARDGREVISSRAYGETMCDLADIIGLFRAHGESVPAAWVAALRDSANFFATGILPTGLLPAGWLLDGSPASDLVCSAGLPAVVALVKAHHITGDRDYAARAQALAEHYYETHARTFDRPFAHSTLDAACEDKEGGIYFFLCAYELLAQTGEERYRAWAEVAVDWLLTFVYVWNPEYDEGAPLRERRFSAVGWPGVSVQNHHVDVFFPVSELWDFGRLVGRSDYTELAERMIHAMGQGISTRKGEWGFDLLGEQAEAFFPTNWQARGTSNTWNPSWVIAQVLYHAWRIRAAR